MYQQIQYIKLITILFLDWLFKIPKGGEMKVNNFQTSKTHLRGANIEINAKHVG